jgi:hypothetical protein
MPGESGCTFGDYARVLTSILHARLRVRRAPGIPHALYFEGSVHARLGRIALRDRERVFEIVRLFEKESENCAS